jgi:hypothetical protein
VRRPIQFLRETLDVDDCDDVSDGEESALIGVGTPPEVVIRLAADLGSTTAARRQLANVI